MLGQQRLVVLECNAASETRFGNYKTWPAQLPYQCQNQGPSLYKARLT